MTKKSVYIIFLIALSLLLISAGPPPVMPSKSLYLNDYASTIFKEHREFILKVSGDIKDKADVDLIVLSVPHLGGANIKDYAEEIVTGWDLRADKTVLLLTSKQDQSYELYIGSDLADVIGEEAILEIAEIMNGTLPQNSFSKGIYSSYKVIARAVYISYGITPAGKIQSELDSEKSTSSNKLVYVFFVGAVFIMLRSASVSRKYRQRYLANQRKYKRNKHEAYTPRSFDDNDKTDIAECEITENQD